MDSKSTFIKRFGDLVALLRADPGNDAAQDLALTAAAAAVSDAPLEIEAGVEWNTIPEELSLKGRCLARQVECLRIAAGADPNELLALARALAHDLTPVPTTPNVQVDMIQLLAPPPPPGDPSPGPGGGGPIDNRRQGVERRKWEERRRAGRLRWTGPDHRGSADRRASGERRLELVRDQRTEIGRLQETLTHACGTLDWDGALNAASRLIGLAPRVPQETRRGYGIQVRRAIPRWAVEALVDLAERDLACRPAAADVLRWIGLDAAEVILDRLRQGELLGVRVFYYDVVGGMPDAFPMVSAMVRSHHAHEIRHGATLLGRLGLAEGVELLEPLLGSRDDLVRAAALHALGALHEGAAANPLRRALHHPSPRTRAAAADAIANWRGGALAILLVTAMDTERDHDAWHAIVMALGRVGTSDACSALTTVALSRRSLLRRQGYSTGQRLAAVGALGASDSPLARTALHRLLRDGEGVVRYAADRVLHSEAQRAG